MARDAACAIPRARRVWGEGVRCDNRSLVAHQSGNGPGFEAARCCCSTVRTSMRLALVAEKRPRRLCRGRSSTLVGEREYPASSFLPSPSLRFSSSPTPWPRTWGPRGPPVPHPSSLHYSPPCYSLLHCSPSWYSLLHCSPSCYSLLHCSPTAPSASPDPPRGSPAIVLLRSS